MKKIHKAIRWEDDRGWMELRFFEPDHHGTAGYVTGHWWAWDGNYHNTACIVDRDSKLDDSQLDTLLHFALHSNADPTDIKDELLKVIGQELPITIQSFGDVNDS